MNTKRINEEVLYAVDQIVKIGYDDVQALKPISDGNVRKRVRVCTHKDVDEQIHEMFIVHSKNTYIQPHKHMNKIESFHIVEGAADIVIFDDTGKISDIVPMGKYEENRTFYYRLSDSLYHTLLISSDYIIFHETTNGPFREEDTIWAPWAPDESDQNGVNKFVKNLEKSIRAGS